MYILVLTRGQYAAREGKAWCLLLLFTLQLGWLFLRESAVSTVSFDAKLNSGPTQRLPGFTMSGEAHPCFFFFFFSFFNWEARLGT